MDLIMTNTLIHRWRLTEGLIIKELRGPGKQDTMAQEQSEKDYGHM